MPDVAEVPAVPDVASRPSSPEVPLVPEEPEGPGGISAARSPFVIFLFAKTPATVTTGIRSASASVVTEGSWVIFLSGIYSVPHKVFCCLND